MPDKEHNIQRQQRQGKYYHHPVKMFSFAPEGEK
jgi:hypothetical protein